MSVRYQINFFTPLSHPSTSSAVFVNKTSPDRLLTLSTALAPESTQPHREEDFYRQVVSSSVYTPQKSSPLSILYIGVTGENDILLDGLGRSKYVQVNQMYLQNTTHVTRRWLKGHNYVDMSMIIVDWSGLKRNCFSLQRILTYADHNDLQNVDMILLDSSGSSKSVLCDWMNNDRTRTAKRSVVRGRRWNDINGWIDHGERIESEFLHITPIVSEAFVEQLRKHKHTSTIKKQVSHYWKAASGDSNPYQYKVLRDSVSVSMGKNKKRYDKEHKLRANTFLWLDQLGLVDGNSASDESTRSSSRNDDKELDFTASQLASSKIVIVTQSDEWEHSDNRLMEALASGAMVMADNMVAPPGGLTNRTNIIFFDSLESLDRLLRYYLIHDKEREVIARRGRELALGRNRSWHVIEKLIFGKALTNVGRESLDEKVPEKQTYEESTEVIPSAIPKIGS
jgi:hypothetical protein